MKESVASFKEKLNPHKEADKEWYLALLDEESQREYEEDRLKAVLFMLKYYYLSRGQKRIRELKAEIEELQASEGYSAADLCKVLEKKAEIEAQTKQLNSYQCFFSEPYFARMDVYDDQEGYNSYYIGKKGDVNLEIVDWRAPLAVRYYQKSRVTFQINEYLYKTVLRRVLSVKNGKLIDFKNEYLSVKDYLTPEEIAGRDEEILFDPYLRRIIKNRKDDVQIRDIIETIQEKQFEVITRPERESFVLQGCAGSGKTMILLHRLSYLMYNNENLSPRNILVITPSRSFNAFIDELSQVLELERIKTITSCDYYFRALENEGIELQKKVGEERESEEYLRYLYSDNFARDVDKRISKIYGDIHGLFTSPECREVAETILSDCKRRRELYTRMKNASLRIRRTAMGDMTERADGGLAFTKPFRNIMSAFVQVEDFLTFVLREEERTPDYFFRQFVEFYRSVKEIAAHGEQAIYAASVDLKQLQTTVQKEIEDLKRYRQKRGSEEIYTYAERIARRKELIEEAEKLSEVALKMCEGVGLVRDFYAVLRQSKCCVAAGKCASPVDVARWLYRETVKKYKTKFGLGGVYPSDGYAMCYVLTAAGRSLTPRYGLVFIDEGQDLSFNEYALLRKIHSDAAFNVFGDVKQNITPWRGIQEWDQSFGNLYELDRNYRNTNEIVDFVTDLLDVDMQPIGLHGAEVERVTLKGLAAFFKDKQGLRAVIAKEEYLPLFQKRGFCPLPQDGISKTKINVMSVYASKGLEFSSVAVYDKGMTENEKYIAYTRALRELVIVED